MKRSHIIVGGGAAGFFAAIRCAERLGRQVLLLEQSSQFLSKVRISGGGRCNVTTSKTDVRALASCYPRGGAALQGPLRVFGPSDTVAWFAQRGVPLKTEADGRMFPATDRSETILECLHAEAARLRVETRTNTGVDGIGRVDQSFRLTIATGEVIDCDRLLIATGGCRGGRMNTLLEKLGHHIEPPVPSLFTFRIALPWLREIAGVTIADAELRVKESRLRERGPVLITHEGLSGPAVLRLSAWGARSLHDAAYRFPLSVNWLPDRSQEEVAHMLDERRRREPARLVINTPLPGLAQRLWERLAIASGIDPQTRWADLTRADKHGLVQQLEHTELPVSGKSLNAEEFVTCGGVRLSEVNLKTMESRSCPGLFFAGEVLDIDGITGGYNFQAAWTTGWVAGTHF